MDMKDLRSRLDSIKQQAALNPAPEKPPDRHDAGIELPEHGWTQVDKMVYEKVSVVKIALPEVVSDILADETVKKIIPDSGFLESDKLVFYDTETTGLSAGAGNAVFLAGFGEIAGKQDETGRELRITQLIMSDFPGEPAFLKRIDDFIVPEKIYVSYNGKAFDANLLKTRYAMNGMKIRFGPQLDLLYPSRKLWKNIIGSCSLGDIEHRILDKKRDLDVPGFMVPDLYFDFIRGGGWSTIRGVAAHHLDDIASLAELLSVMEKLFADSEYGASGFCDQLGLASILSQRRPAAAIAVLETAFDKGNIRAGAELSLMLKRSGRRDEAVGIWERMWNESRSIFAGIELAKHHEHKSRRIDIALSVTDELLNLERIRILPYRQELQNRKARLERKAESSV